MISRRGFVATSLSALTSTRCGAPSNSRLMKNLSRLGRDQGLSIGQVTDDQMQTTTPPIPEGRIRSMHLECCRAWIPAIDQTGQRISGVTMNGIPPEGTLSFVVVDQCGRIERSIPTTMLPSANSLAPDGKHLALLASNRVVPTVGFFVSSLAAPNDNSLIRWSASHEGTRYITMSWSPETDRLVFNDERTIYLYDLRTKAVRSLTEGACPTWSPDGSRIAYRSLSGHAAAIDPDGKAISFLGGRKITNRVHWCPIGPYVMIGQTGLMAHLRGVGNLASTELVVIDLQTEEELVIMWPMQGADDFWYDWFRLTCPQTQPQQGPSKWMTDLDALQRL